MINTLKIFDDLKETMEASAARKITEVIAAMYEELKNSVTKVEFNELKEIVSELAEAQKRTELRLEELAEAQKRTELRLEELAEAQKRTELRLEELAEAQKRTELRLEELAEAQKRTELRLEELAEAQKRTEEEVRKLVHEHGDTRKQLGGLSMTVGYTLENEAYKALPRLLKRDAGLTIKGKLNRQYVTDNKGQYIEVNIVGEAAKNGKKIFVVGEGKSQLSKNDVDDFIRKKLNRLEGVFANIFPVLITHMISSPGIGEYAKKKGIALYYSYDF